MQPRWVLAVLLVLSLLLRWCGAQPVPRQIMDVGSMRRPGLRSLTNTGTGSPVHARRAGGIPTLNTLSGMDMRLTRSQYQRLHGPSRKRARSGDTMLAVPWTDAEIPYEIQDSDFNSTHLEWIREAIYDWERLTCIRFRDATSDDTKHKVLIKTGLGCSAQLGMANMYPQHIILDTNGVGCFWKGLIHHELGHTIGLIHEHQREQRDGYIRVNYYRVDPSVMDNLEKYAEGVDNKLGLPYDYKSVMHYDKNAFSSGVFTQTIHTRDPAQTDVIGMTLTPSFLDAKLVNKMYKCAERCQSPPSCSERCFVNEYCKCICEHDIPKENCRDIWTDCKSRRDGGECITQFGLMHHNCRKTCGICTSGGSIPELVCMDNDPECHQKAAKGDCKDDYHNMQFKCRKSCKICEPIKLEKGPCRDNITMCKQMAKMGMCERNMTTMLEKCPKSCNFCPEDLGKQASKSGCVDEDAALCAFRADSNLCSKYYALMTKVCPVACKRCNHRLPAGCKDTNPGCQGWAFRGECTFNPAFMLKGCPFSCDTCEGLNKPDVGCLDFSLKCQEHAEDKECFANPEWTKMYCQKTCKRCPGDPPLKVPCEDFSPHCQILHDQGMCESNALWMGAYCKVTCKKCKPDKPVTARPPVRPKPAGKCADKHDDCKQWGEAGHCILSPGSMLSDCKESCGICNATCLDKNESCEDWAKAGECDKRPDIMLFQCQLSCGICYEGNH
uniref:Metalloendopeptidase n=1 Tax=Colubraria reticulata TaxID=604273 RepID=A0A481SMK9_9CAEN|nr:CreM12-ShK2 [Colubraria reticulata]